MDVHLRREHVDKTSMAPKSPVSSSENLEPPLPMSRGLTLIQTVIDVVSGLRYALDDEEHVECSYERPSAILQYPIVWDWHEHIPDPDQTKIHEMAWGPSITSTHGTYYVNPSVWARNQQVNLLRYLTGDICILRTSKGIKVGLPGNLSDDKQEPERIYIRSANDFFSREVSEKCAAPLTVTWQPASGGYPNSLWVDGNIWCPRSVIPLIPAGKGVDDVEYGCGVYVQIQHAVVEKDYGHRWAYFPIKVGVATWQTDTRPPNSLIPYELRHPGLVTASLEEREQVWSEIFNRLDVMKRKIGQALCRPYPSEDEHTQLLTDARVKLGSVQFESESEVINDKIRPTADKMTADQVYALFPDEDAYYKLETIAGRIGRKKDTVHNAVEEMMPKWTKVEKALTRRSPILLPAHRAKEVAWHAYTTPRRNRKPRTTI